jgi:hypothetical protein
MGAMVPGDSGSLVGGVVVGYNDLTTIAFDLGDDFIDTPERSRQELSLVEGRDNNRIIDRLGY